MQHYTHLPECTTGNMQNQNLNLYPKILEYLHSQLSKTKKRGHVLSLTVRQLYRVERLHPPQNPLAGAMLRSTLEGHDLVKFFFEYHVQ